MWIKVTVEHPNGHTAEDYESHQSLGRAVCTHQKEPWGLYGKDDCGDDYSLENTGFLVGNSYIPDESFADV